MKELLYMYLPDCPFCRQADRILEGLINECPTYREIPVRRVDESEEPEFADSLDYYYVPTFFVDGQNLLEGVPTEEKIRAALDAALEG